MESKHRPDGSDDVIDKAIYQVEYEGPSRRARDVAHEIAKWARLGCGFSLPSSTTITVTGWGIERPTPDDDVKPDAVIG